jgi:hypothetical protein
MKPVPKSHGKPDILISFMFANHDDMFAIDQSEDGGSIRFNGETLEKGGDHFRITNVIQNMSRKGKEAGTERVSFGLEVFFHKPELVKGVEDGEPFALMNPDFSGYFGQPHLEIGIFTQTEKDPGGLFHRRDNGLISGFLLG